MHYKYRILMAILAALLLVVFAGCSNINNSNSNSQNGDEELEDIGTTTTETASATLERPDAPTHTARPEKSQPPELSAATGEAGYGVGDVLPDFSVPTADGGTFTLSDHLGQPVFINLFTTWCGPCVGEMPEINQLYKDLGSEVTFIVIDIGEDMQTVQSFASDNGYSLPFACAGDGAPFGSGYYVEYIPQTFVLSANGTIVEFFGGSSDYETFKAAIEAAQ